MNEVIITTVSNLLSIKEKQIEAVINLLNEGATIPFIARYRKEVTGYLNEDEIRTIHEVYEYQINLAERKETRHLFIEVIKSLSKKDVLWADEFINHSENFLIKREYNHFDLCIVQV